MRIFICFLVFSFSVNIFAQNIAINTTGAANSTGSMLEILQPSTTTGTSGLFVRHSGATTTAYGLWVEMTGAVTNKYAIIVPSGSGSVGIGTSAPSYNLHVSSASAWSAKFASTAASNGGIYVDAATGYNANIALQENAVDKWYLGNRASDDRFSIIESTGAAEVLAILQGGNVGIGTVSANNLLTVNGKGSFGGTVANTGSEPIEVQGAGAGISFYDRTGGSAERWVIYSSRTGIAGTNTLRFWTGGDKVGITSGGNFGIGTITPGAKLEVQGTFKLVDGTQALNRVLTSDANGLATWGTGTGLGEWSDGGAFIYPTDGDAEKVSIGQSDGSPLSGATPQLLVYTDANYGTEASVNFYNDENANSQTATVLDLQFGNCTTVGADDKFIRFIRGLSTEVGSISGEVTYTTFTGGHVGQSNEDGSVWVPGMIVSSHGDPVNPTMGRALVKIGLAKTAKDRAAIGVYTNREFPHHQADMDTTRPVYYYNALGEGLILVSDLGGDIAIGDYITSSNRAGYGMKQDDDLLHNYTVAKATDSIKWSAVPVDPKFGFKWKLIACTYHGG